MRMNRLLLYGIVFSMFVSYLATPAETCSNNKESSPTGAACSVSDLKDMSKYKYAQENSLIGPTSPSKSKNDLRPILINSSAKNQQEALTGCKIGLCITEQLFESRP